MLHQVGDLFELNVKPGAKRLNKVTQNIVHICIYLPPNTISVLLRNVQQNDTHRNDRICLSIFSLVLGNEMLDGF